MERKNAFCIYQRNGVCILDEISIDNAGMCTEYTITETSDDYLKKSKQKTLERFEKEYY